MRQGERAPDFELADQDGNPVKLYKRKFWGNERTTFVIDGQGTVCAVLRKIRPKAHDDMVLKVLAGA